MINLNDLLNGNVKEEKKVESKNRCTANQIKFYKDLCAQKSVEIDKNHEEWDYQFMSSKISELLKMKRVIKATNKQINKIIELSERLDMPTPKKEALDKMDIESASNLISKLIERDKKHNDKPTEQQLALLVDMFQCPEIPRFDIIPIHPTLLKEKETFQLLNKRMMENNIEKVKDKHGTIYTLKEVQDYLVEKNKEIEDKFNNYDLTKLSRKDVGNFIQDNREKFYNWKNERVTKGQIDFIKTLQERISRLYNWSTGDVSETPTDIEGNRIEDVQRPITDEMILTGQYQLTDDDLIQLSKNQATELIDKMQKELYNKDNERGFEKEPEYDDSLMRKVTTMQEASVKEQEKILNMFHRLYALIGQEADNGTIMESNLQESLKDLLEICSVYASKEQIYAVCEELLNKEEVDAILG